MSDWPLVSLKDAGVTLIDCEHKTPKAQENGKPYIGIPQLKDGRIVLDGVRLISEEDFSKWRLKAKPGRNDVILSRRCNPGEAAYVPEGLEIALGQNLVLLRSDGKTVYPPFLRWVTQGPNWWQQVGKYINVGAVFDSLKCADIPKFEIRLPPHHQQKKIVDILGSLDKKIELNHQINQTLEQIAQAIFKSWFVDFEPVKAKIEARQNGQDPERAAMCAISGKTDEQLDQLTPEQIKQLTATAALFPDELEASELGPIPKGWKVTNFGEVSTCFDSKRVPLSKRQRKDKQGHIPYYGATSVMDYVDDYLFDGIYLLVGEDGSVLREDGTPFIQYIWGKSWVNNHAHVLQGRNGISTEQLVIFIRIQNITAYVTGAVQLKLNQKNMNSIPFIEAVKEINEKFYSLIEPLYGKIRQGTEEIASLVSIRDALLPKLLSGELTLNDAKRKAEAVA